MARKDDGSGESLYKTQSKVRELGPLATYRTSNLLSTFNWVVSNFADFRYMNVYTRETKEYLISFSKNFPPSGARYKAGEGFNRFKKKTE